MLCYVSVAEDFGTLFNRL